METERATVDLLKEIFSNSLVGLEFLYGELPPNLKGKKAVGYIKMIAKEPYIDHSTILTIIESTYKVTHKASPQGCTMLIQQLEGIQHQLKEAHHNTSVEKLELTDNEIIHFGIKQLQKPDIIHTIKTTKTMSKATREYNQSVS